MCTSSGGAEGARVVEARSPERDVMRRNLLGEHADWGAHEAAELPYLQAEEYRLLYVAATRARQLLVVSRWTGNANNTAWRVLDGFLGQARELSVPAAVTTPAVVPLDCSMAVQTAAAEAREKCRHA
jgi:ATP-dependent helicase/nuclease subunit A